MVDIYTYASIPFQVRALQVEKSRMDLILEEKLGTFHFPVS